MIIDERVIEEQVLEILENNSSNIDIFIEFINDPESNLPQVLEILEIDSEVFEFETKEKLKKLAKGVTRGVGKALAFPFKLTGRAAVKREILLIVLAIKLLIN